VNEIILEISSRGRRFFHHDGNVATIFEKKGRLYMKNEYNGVEMYMHTKFGYPPPLWHHGGTLWGLTKDFKEYIMTGKPCNGSNGYGGLYSPHWGYPESEMQSIREKAKELSYLK